jgi:transcriptional regulator with XRE-family HTH domain
MEKSCVIVFAMKAKKSKVTLGNKIALIRKNKGLTQEDLGKMLGISRRAVAYYEKEANTLTIEMLKKISSCLDVDLSELIGDEKPLLENSSSEEKTNKRLKKFDQLSKNDQKAVIRFINALAKK